MRRRRRVPNILPYPSTASCLSHSELIGRGANAQAPITMSTIPAESTLAQAISADGTAIGYWISGEGPPLVLVHGLLGDHSRWGVLIPYLDSHFTIYAMDRRGRGASGDHPEYDFAREVEDVVAVVEAVTEAAGEQVVVLVNSLGGSFALAAAASTKNIGRLVIFEPPGREVLAQVPDGFANRLDELLAAGDREGTLELAYRTIAGMSDQQIQHLRGQPEWPNRVAAAHTVPRELRLPPDDMFDPEQAASISASTLLLVGSESPAPYRASAEAVAAVVPHVRIKILEGQGHAADILAPAMFAEHVVGFLLETSRGPVHR